MNRLAAGVAFALVLLVSAAAGFGRRTPERRGTGTRYRTIDEGKSTSRGRKPRRSPRHRFHLQAPRRGADDGLRRSGGRLLGRRVRRHAEESQTAAQETNSSSVTGDDYVGVYLYPQGTRVRLFVRGEPARARYQTPAKTPYTPSGPRSARRARRRVRRDDAHSARHHSQRRIENVARAVRARDDLRRQFCRLVVRSARAERYRSHVLGHAHGHGQGAAAQGASRPKPRFGVYGLSESTSKENGGSTSRVGMDFAIPVTPTASFVGALHPDYSNVEIDQQTISPQAFARQYAEVRPFFTQAASYSTSTSLVRTAHRCCTRRRFRPSRKGTRSRDARASQFRRVRRICERPQRRRTIANYNDNDPNANFSFNAQRVGVSFAGVTDVTSTFSTGTSTPRRISSSTSTSANTARTRSRTLREATTWRAASDTSILRRPRC